MSLTSPHRDVALHRRSVFTHLLGVSQDHPGLVGGFPARSPAFVDAATGTVVTRAALREYALQFAYSLRNLPPPLSHPPHPPTVLVFSPNTIAWPVLLHGVAAAGFRATLVNSAYTPAELAYQCSDAGAHLVFVHPTLVHVVLEALRSAGCTESDIRARLVLMTSHWLTGVPDPVSEDIAHFTRLEALMGRGTLPREVDFDGERSNETLYLCYSSGTTGQPKGVETTHYNLTSVIEITKPAWPNSIPCLTPSLPASTADPQPDVFFGCLPYFHIYGAIKLLLFPLSLGTPTVITAGFDPVRFCETIERYRATVVLVVPPILVALARHEALEKYNMTSIRVVFTAAAPVGANLLAAVSKRLRKIGANAVITQAYGLTETSPTLTLLHPDDAATRVGTVGRVLPNLEVRLVREDAGEVITDIDNAGEIWVRGPTVMKGYLNNPAATALSITPDGWFKTGDIAVSDANGFLTIVDRRKELIKYKGFQGKPVYALFAWHIFADEIVVPPAELEALLLQHPDVVDAAVVGVDSKDEATELPRAYVVPARPIPHHEIAAYALEVQAWAAGRVAPHKRLRGGVVVVDQIPKSASGKILRRELRERCKDELGHGQVVPKAKL